MMDKYLFCGDMLEILPLLRDLGHNSVKMIFADLPYGKTDHEWDTIIDLTRMWTVLPYCTSTFTASSGFEFTLYNSNPAEYCYKWIWNKNNSGGFANARKRPLNVTEDILVFRTKSEFYHPQMEVRGASRKKGGYKASLAYSGIKSPSVSFNNEYFPKSLINISNNNQKQKRHPTQKPVELLEYLIKTYTLPGDLVLDPCMGSGSTGEACFNTGRSFIGIEKDETIFADTESYLELIWNKETRPQLEISDI